MRYYLLLPSGVCFVSMYIPSVAIEIKTKLAVELLLIS